jgi:hypothetical protein
MQQCGYCNSTHMTRYWLKDTGVYLRCDECLREFFDDGSLIPTRFDLYLRLKTLEDNVKQKESEISLMETRVAKFFLRFFGTVL